jgi:hypothetical protein
MTKPTGRPRGRPKTKEYVTLMTRVDITLADEVKRYASLHRQPISVVIRDALTLLMEEYPFAGDRSSPYRLAAHEFLSDSNTPAYDTSKHYLGKLCPRRHDYLGTGKSLLRQTNHLCLACDRERAQERRQAQRTQGCSSGG